MSRPRNPLVRELLEYFEQDAELSGPHYLDLPRAMVVEGIPEHRPARDFVELPKAPIRREELLREFLEAHGIRAEGETIEVLCAQVRGADLSDDFAAYFSESVRAKAQDWLDAQGVVYTA